MQLVQVSRLWTRCDLSGEVANVEGSKRHPGRIFPHFAPLNAGYTGAPVQSEIELA
jgi:hypothetical protein